MSSLLIPPALHSSGSSQRASAFLSRPTLTENQTDGPNASRGRGLAASSASLSSSGADCRSRCTRKNAAASCGALNCVASLLTKASSSSLTGSFHGVSTNRRSSSRARTSVAEGGAPHSAVSFANRSRRSALPRIFTGTISAEVPLAPARPVRPDRCKSVSELLGSSA